MQILGLCLSALLLCKLLERYAKEQAMLLSIAASAGLLLFVFLRIAPLLEEVQTLFSVAGLAQSHATLLCKALGICYLTQFGSDICRDCAETAIGSAVLLAGKVGLLLLTLPLLQDLLTTIREVLA